MEGKLDVLNNEKGWFKIPLSVRRVDGTLMSSKVMSLGNAATLWTRGPRHNMPPTQPSFYVNCTKTIQEVLDLITHFKTARRSRSVPWWNERLDSLRTHVLNILRRVRRGKGGQCLWDALTKKTRKYTNILRLCGCEYCSRYDIIGDISMVVRLVKQKPTATFGLLCDFNGTMADTPETTIKNILVFYFPGSERDPDLVWDAFSVSSLEESDDFDGVITLEKLETSVLSFHNFKVVGTDIILPCAIFQ
ncbi:unnamed protein product [Lepeophtheirus salmonis]|uniref:(salmon louse) hypothetical protein n=1 Tax=Lepeophtheirus salmonis TaxID=72036 RepID=A0A7R8CK92_LEPSM|nr:unnamed protein product [Lepeophtheirus salmonis]CAF2800854.1 unnamed protein product [Lepeophtheirus salmonis]